MCNVVSDKDVKNYMAASGEFDDKSEEIRRLKNQGLDDDEIREVLNGNQSEYDFIDDPDEVYEDDDYYGEDDFVNDDYSEDYDDDNDYYDEDDFF